MATSQPLGLLLQYGCRSIASLGLALYTSWRLSLVTLAGVPVFSAVIAYLTVWMKKSITAQQVELTEASKIANNTISSIDTVKCLNAETCEAENYGRRIDRSAFYYLKQARLNSTQIALIRWMMFGMFVQGFWYGSGLARDGKLSSGEVIRTFWACTTAAQSIEQVLPQVLVMEKGKFASAFLHALVRDRGRRRMISELRGTQYPSYCDGRVEVKNVRALVSDREYCLTFIGFICVPFSTRDKRPQSIEFLLPPRGNQIRNRKEWLRKKHTQPASYAILSP